MDVNGQTPLDGQRLSTTEFPRFRTKEEYAYQYLRSAILRCELAPGHKLVVDALSQDMGISPIPIRAAVQRLQSEGLVEITPHTGAVVSDISPEHIEQVFLLLEHLESIGFQVAAVKATPSDLDHLARILDEMERAYQAGDSDAWAEWNGQFHRAVAAVTEMRMVIEFTGRVLDSWDRLRRWYLRRIVSQRMPQAQSDHRRIFELLCARDLGPLMELTAQHNRKALKDYQELIRNSLVQHVPA